MDKYITDKLLEELVEKYGTPFYLYDQQTIINRINQMKQMVELPNVQINYATKANSNLEILKIMQAAGLKADATGLGEVYVNKQAGFTDEQIYVVGNNFSQQELSELAKQNLPISLDAIEQIEWLNQVAPCYQKVLIRVNPSFGAGDNASIITGGDQHKFGIDICDIPKALELLDKNKMKLIGINQHIGSLNLNYHSIVEAVKELIAIVQGFELNDLEVINFGGGFGINYYRRHYFEELNFKSLSEELTKILKTFLQKYPNKNVSLEFEPGRFLTAEAGVLIGQVTSIKKRGGIYYIGTDLGFSNFLRPTLYDSYHELEFLTANEKVRKCNVVGNMCESGDYLAQNRELTIPAVGDTVIVYDTGAYGFSMASNYNNKLKPIELLLNNESTVEVIRQREALSDLLRGFNI